MRNFRLDDESGHQEALFSWAAYQLGRMPELEYLHHVPNGGRKPEPRGSRGICECRRKDNGS